MDGKNSRDTFSIMLATDIHLGVNEKDSIRANDSFITFEEILKISKEKEVDFILLGGDLFHDNKPSAQCLHKCFVLLRKYCMGDKPIHVEFISDQNAVFKNCAFPTVNYEDPNFNISIPVFSIHGNHDDPSGFGRMSALDLVSDIGLVNYFGKWTDLNKVEIYPLMLQKGSSKMAIYGLSHLKDERLFRLMKQNEVNYVRPEGNVDDYFNLMVLHQNRVERPGTNHIPESLLPSFIDLVFWGHEHDCRVNREWNQEKQFFVTQPGSPVATSLSEGESLKKHVAILKICGQHCDLEAIPLKTTRPFVFNDVKLSDWNMKFTGKSSSEVIQDYVDRYVRSKLLPNAEDQITGDPNQPKLPLIRLRIEFENDLDYFNAIRFGQTFTGLVANPSDMVLMKKKSITRTTRIGNRPSDNPELYTPKDINMNMTEHINQFLDNLPEKSQLKVISRAWMCEAISRFVDKDDKEALEDVVYNDIKKVRGFLEKENANPDNVFESIEKLNQLRLDRIDEEGEEVNRFLDGDLRHKRDSKLPVSTISRTDDLSDDDFGPPAPTLDNGTKGGRGRGRGRGRGSSTRGSRGAASSNKSSSSLKNVSSIRDSFSSASNKTNNTTRRSSSRSTSSRTITSFYGRNDSDENSDDVEEMFLGNQYKPSPKKKMKFAYSDN